MPEYAEIIKQARWDGSVLHAQIGDDWSQGRTIFGGLSVGIALNAGRRLTEEARPLRSALVSFVNPVRPGPAHATPRVLRAGRNVTHMQIEVAQEELCCTVLACYGSDRETPVHVPARSMPARPDPDELQAFPFIPGITPTFARYVDYRWTEESIPYMGQGKGASSGWVRLQNDQGPMTAEHLALLSDAWPSPALAMLRAPTPISSLTWNLEILHPTVQGSASDWWAISAHIDSASDGYIFGDAMLWSADGVLVARSRQTVSVYKRS